MSPYIGLLNRNASSASNYYSIVRPQQRQQRINETTQLLQYNQERDLQSLKAEQDRGFDQHQVKPTGTAGWYQDPGTKQSFRFTDHYYGQWQNGGQGRPARR